MSDCIFCKIAAGEIPSTKVYEDDLCLAFRDLNPQAPTHILVIPKDHIQSVDEIDASNEAVVGHIFSVIAKVAKDEGLDKGYRVVSNIGEQGQQTVNTRQDILAVAVIAVGETQGTVTLTPDIVIHKDQQGQFQKGFRRTDHTLRPIQTILFSIH